MKTSMIFEWDPDNPISVWHTIIAFFKVLLKGQYIIKPYSPPRNLEQNALYHTLLGWVEKQTGNDSEYLHEMMGKKYLAGRRRRVKVGKVTTYQTIVKSTTKLSKKEFSEYFQKVELFFIENGVPPMPPIDTPEFLSLMETYGK